MRVIGVITLIASIISAIVIYLNFGTMEVVKGTYHIYTTTEPNIIGIMISIAVLWEGIVFCVFAYIIADINENLKELLRGFNKLTKYLIPLLLRQP